MIPTPGTTSACSSRRARPRAARGFTFTEVLFTVLVLAIAFLMVAAIFPIAMTQTRNVAENTQLSLIGARAFDRMRATLLDGTLMPETGDAVVPFANQPALYQAVRGDLIATGSTAAEGKKYAIIPFYRRAANDAFATIYLVILHREGGAPEFDPADFEPGGIYDPVPVMGVELFDGDGLANADDPGPDTIDLAAAFDEAGRGAYLIVSSPGNAGPPVVNRAQTHGRVLRLGVPDPNNPLQIFEVDRTSGDLRFDPNVSETVDAWLVGRVEENGSFDRAPTTAGVFVGVIPATDLSP